MDIQFYGANCVSFSDKQVRVVVDDTLASLGAKGVLKNGDIVLFTNSHDDITIEPKLLIDQPGEYEASNVSVYGIPLRAHMDEDKSKSATAYKIIMNDVRVLVIGHAYPELNERELEQIGTVDVLVVPVGGNGYTIDPVGALKLIKKIEPKLIIPTHYDDPALTFPVPQQTLEQAITVLAIEPKQTTDKLKLKASDLSESTELVVVERTK